MNLEDFSEFNEHVEALQPSIPLYLGLASKLVLSVSSGWVCPYDALPEREAVGEVLRALGVFVDDVHEDILELLRLVRPYEL